MKNACLLLLLITSVITEVSAQFYTAQNKVWAFGYGEGLDFNSGTPVPIHTGIYTFHSSASVCNDSGDLLFYTNGKSVYNKTGAMMPSGAAIVPFQTHSAPQGAVIMPVIGDTGRYYIFSLEEVGFSGVDKCKLAYSIVDMRLDGGLGDVVDSSAGTILYDHLGGGMVAVAGNNNNIWLISNRFDTSLFVVFNVTSAGVSDTVLLSYPGVPASCSFHGGIIKVSHNRLKIAWALHNCTNRPAIYDFDPATGAITNEVQIGNPAGVHPVYSLEFSPDSKLLYVDNSSSPEVAFITQYNIELPDASAIQASEVKITDSAGFGGLRLGPDGKIYFPELRKRFMGRINAPNNSGLACDYEMHVIEKTNPVLWGLPPIYVTTDTNYSWVSPPTYIPKIAPIKEIAIFPNPSSRELMISSTEMIFVVRLYNLIGQELIAYKGVGGKEIRLNVSQLPPGVYLVHIDETTIRRFVKE